MPREWRKIKLTRIAWDGGSGRSFGSGGRNDIRLYDQWRNSKCVVAHSHYNERDLVTSSNGRSLTEALKRLESGQRCYALSLVVGSGRLSSSFCGWFHIRFASWTNGKQPTNHSRLQIRHRQPRVRLHPRHAVSILPSLACNSRDHHHPRACNSRGGATTWRPPWQVVCKLIFSSWQDHRCNASHLFRNVSTGSPSAQKAELEHEKPCGSCVLTGIISCGFRDDVRSKPSMERMQTEDPLRVRPTDLRHQHQNFQSPAW